jgi:ANTAR domain/GAF domain
MGAKLSRTTVRLAMAALQNKHGLDQNTAFDVLRDVSQRHNVKLRVVAAGMIAPHTGAPTRAEAARPPLPFTGRGRACTNRAEVVAELMRVAISRSGAERGTVQLHDFVHGGMQLEGWRGFSQDFVDTLSYVSADDTSCGQAFSDAQVVVTDVDSSPLLSESARERLLANDVRSCVTTPIVDDDGAVRGIVSTHQTRPDAVPTTAELGQLWRMASQCGRWLQWYDQLVLPTVVAAVHEAAAAKVGGADSAGTATLADPALTIAHAARLLTDRYGVEKSHSRKMLASIAHRRGVSVHALAKQLTAGIDP